MAIGESWVSTDTLVVPGGSGNPSVVLCPAGTDTGAGDTALVH